MIWSTFFHHWRRSWQGHFLMQISTLFVLVSTGLVLATALVFRNNFGEFMNRWSRDVQVTVFLRDDVSPEQTSQIEKLLAASGHFSQVSYVSKAQAKERFSKQMGRFTPDALSDKEIGNPLPASFELQVASALSSSSDLGGLRRLAEEVGRFAGVDEVIYGQGWIENYATAVRWFEWTSLALAVLLLSGTSLVIYLSIGATIEQRREEIEILELIGAPLAQIRLPYVLEGGMLGALAGVLSVGLTWLAAAILNHEFGGRWQILGITGEWQSLALVQGALLASLLAAAGALMAWLRARRLASGWAAASGVGS